MMRKINLMLWARKKRRADNAGPDHQIVIMLRISVQQRRHLLNVHTGFETVKSNWQAGGANGRVKGQTEVDEAINAGITKLLSALHSIHADLERRGLPVTARSIWDAYLKKEESIPDAPVRRVPLALPVFSWPRL